MLDTLVGRLAAAGLSARAGLADTPGAAHAVARHGAGALAIVSPSAQADALALLPVRALRITDSGLCRNHPGEATDITVLIDRLGNRLGAGRVHGTVNLSNWGRDGARLGRRARGCAAAAT